MAEKDLDVVKAVNITMLEMLALEPECSINLHVADSDTMAIDLFQGLIKELPERYVIGVPTAAIRHKIAYRLEIPVNTFSFIKENKSDLTKVLPTNTGLVLWDYLNLSQPLAKNLIYRGWKQIDLFVILRNLVTSTGERNTSLYNLIIPEN
jgi:hypothetical protein